MDTVENHVLTRPPAAALASFWSEFQDYWARVPDKWLFLTMLAGWCVLFQFAGISSFNFGAMQPSLFQWMNKAWAAPAMDCGHGILVPFAVAIFFWVKRRELAASIAGVWRPGL